MRRPAFLGLLVLAFILPIPASPQDQETIEDVRIRGNRRVTEETIRFYIQTRKGDPFDFNRVLADHRALLRLKSFEDVQIDISDGETGKIITFIVKEYPLIRSIKYQGNKSFSESDILEHFKNKKLGLTVDSQYDPAKVVEAERALRELLEKHGKPLGDVKHEVEYITDTSVEIRFVIEEGPKVRIGRIDFEGNTVFSDGRLRDALKLTKERSFISALRGRDKYEKLKLEADLDQNVRKLYQEHGYIAVQIGEPRAEIREGPRGFIPLFRKTKQQYFITIPIVEGDQYRLGELKITGAKLFTQEQLLPLFGMKKGDVVNFTKIRDALENIRKLYGANGYINWNYIPQQDIDRENKIFNLTLDFQEDQQFRVRRINFAGNTKTRDKVMRREFLIDEGEVFNSFRLEQSILRLNQLGFFEKIEEKDYEVKPDPNTATVEINVKVKEKGQQSIGLTGGTSGISGSFIGLSYSANNFRGKGQRLEFDITAGTRTTNFLFSFTDPYFRDSRLTLGFSVFNQRLRFDTFNTFGLFGGGEIAELFTRNTSGIQVSASYPWRTWWRLGASYTVQSISITDIQRGLEPFAISTLVGFTPGGTRKEALEGIVRSQITPSLIYNTTNHPLDPTFGQQLSVSMDIAGGPLSGDFNLLRPQVEWRWFKPDRWLLKRSGTTNVLALRVLVGFVTGFSGKPIPIFDRYFSGGENLVRGFDIRSISPWAVISTPQFDEAGNPIIDPETGLQVVSRSPSPIGGDTLINANFEYRIPIAGPLSIAAFFDAGTARISRRAQLGRFGESFVTLLENTNTVLRTSTGVEVLFLLPVINVPFRLIFAFNPNRFKGELTDGLRVFRAEEPSRDIKFTIGRAF